jgi:cyclic pyranopterin monophosphate synthase
VKGRKEKAEAQRPNVALSHVGADGAARMVDVSDKSVTAREAVAAGRITMSAEAVGIATSGVNRKGDPVQTARLAGVMAAKRTAELIPLCHPLPLSFVDVDIAARADGFDITATARTSAQTGVEMEALTAVAVGLLTVYDMVKAVDRGMSLGEIVLEEKSGGRSGVFRRAGR